MTAHFPPPPDTTQPLAPTRPSEEARALLALRRSAGKNTLTTPGPTGDALDDLLRVAARAPDHRRVEPWRFIAFEGDDRAAFGDVIEHAFLKDTPDATEEQRTAERMRFLRAPVVVAVISSPNEDHKTPVWEQQLSAGAVCQNLLLAANAAGWAGCWLTEWIAYDDRIAAAMDLAGTEQVAGFIYLGTATADPPERPRPDMTAKVSRWRPGA